MRQTPNFSRRPSLLALLSIALSACAIGPNYQRPTVDLPDRYVEVAEASAPRIQPDWWSLFQSPTLTTLVEAGLKNNLDLAIAAARIREATGLSQEADAAFIPQIDAEASTARLHSSGKTQAILGNVNTPQGTLGTSYTNRRATLTTSYEVDVWGKLRRSSEAADANAQSSVFAHDAARISLAAMITSGYLSLCSLDAQLQASSNTVNTREETRRLIALRVQSGLSSPVEQYQADAALATAQAQQASLRQQRSVIETQLGLLTGQASLRLPTQAAELPAPPMPPAGLPSDLLANRPDIRQAEANLIAANARIGVAKSAFLPKLALTGYLGSESRELGDLFRTGAGIWSSGFALSLPIFDFGRTQARVAQATAQQSQAVAAYQKSIQTAFKEVSDALVALRETQTAETAQGQRREAAQKARQIARQRYTAGAAGYLELLETERSANDAEIAWATSRQNRLTASVDLFKVLGGGWLGK